jgi:hypothetical protein
MAARVDSGNAGLAQPHADRMTQVVNPEAVQPDVRIVSQRAERAARIFRLDVNSRSSGAARLPNLKGEP